MTREHTALALVLACREALPGHLAVTLLSREGDDSGEGGCEIRSATLFGGRKSRLRAMVSPWHTGRIWLYGQKSGGAEKITDFDVERYRHTFRESFPKAQAASLVSELVIKTKAAGGAPRCWVLVNAFLDGLDRAAEEETGAALARFLWRYLDALGLQPPLDACVACGRPFGAGDSLVYAAGENGFLCPECAPSAGGGPSLSGEGAAYLRALSSLGAKEARNIPLSAGEEGRLKGFLFFLIQAACGERFKTLETFVPD